LFEKKSKKLPKYLEAAGLGCAASDSGGSYPYCRKMVLEERPSLNLGDFRLYIFYSYPDFVTVFHCLAT